MAMPSCNVQTKTPDFADHAFCLFCIYPDSLPDTCPWHPFTISAIREYFERLISEQNSVNNPSHEESVSWIQTRRPRLWADTPGRGPGCCRQLGGGCWGLLHPLFVLSHHLHSAVASRPQRPPVTMSGTVPQQTASQRNVSQDRQDRLPRRFIFRCGR